MTKAVAYLRVSGPSQLDGNGFERQLEAVAAWAEIHAGYEGVERLNMPSAVVQALLRSDIR